MAAQIKFGTSGWRAILADGFTLENVRRAVAGIAKHVAGEKPGQTARVVVGRDPRFMGETFVQEAARILSAFGVQPAVIADAAPTPAIAYEVVRTKADGAINFTASHNPPEYNGIKFSTPDGAPALPEVTKQIESLIANLGGDDFKLAVDGKSALQSTAPQTIDVRANYLKRVADIVDLKEIARAKLRVVFDSFWGAARGYPDTLLREAGIDVTSVHDYRDVLFGGHAPEPDDHLLHDCKQAMLHKKAHIGIATDGDADRFGIVDQDGSFIQPNYIIALLFEYLAETRGWKNGVAKSVATTNLINALAQHLGVELFETPVGFKYIGELIIQDKIAIGGEESAGLTVRYHVPEKDGIIAGLLCCEMVARRGKSLRQQLDELFGKVGSFYPRRDNFRLTSEVQEKFTKKVQTDPKDLGGIPVKQVVRTDGLKLIFGDGAWVLYRLSGTEPVVRVYTEARSERDASRLAEVGREWVMQ